jgi:hypothetical protein
MLIALKMIAEISPEATFWRKHKTAIVMQPPVNVHFLIGLLVRQIRKQPSAGQQMFLAWSMRMVSALPAKCSIKTIYASLHLSKQRLM